MFEVPLFTTRAFKFEPVAPVKVIKSPVWFWAPVPDRSIDCPTIGPVSAVESESESSVPKSCEGEIDCEGALLVITVPPSVEGKVNEVASVPAKVKELFTTSVLPAAIFKVLVPLLVIVKPFIVPDASTFPVAETENLDTRAPPATSDLEKST